VELAARFAIDQDVADAHYIAGLQRFPASPFLQVNYAMFLQVRKQ